MLKNPPASAGDVKEMSSVPESRSFNGGENSSMLQNSCLEDPIDRGAWWTKVHGVAKSQT